MKKIFLFLFVLILSFIIAPSAKADSASLYLSPASGSFLKGSVFTVSVFVNTEENEINTVCAELKFPADKLQITSPTAGTSFIAEWLTPPNYSNKDGIISFRGGIPKGITTSAGLVSAITFRAVSSGIAKIEFRQGSKILLNDGKGTDILTDTRDSEYNILIPPSEGPDVSSPTHPNSNVWYPDSSPFFSWEKEEGVIDFSWSFDQNPNTRPDGISEGEQTMASFSKVKDGIWYFHLRQKKDKVWGKTSHSQIRVDTTSPEEFFPRVETPAGLISEEAMVYFESKDDFSGIDHYEVSVIDLSDKESARSFFTEEISPYKIFTKKVGKYNVIIKAVDKAGNIREQEVKFRLITPLISHIEAQGLEIRGILFHWWLIYCLLGVVLILLSFGIYHILRGKNLAGRLKKEVVEAEKEIRDVRELEEKIRKIRVLEEEAGEESKRLAKGLMGKKEPPTKF